MGNELNHARATMLLAQAHALLGHGRTALAYAQEMRDYFLARQESADWEVALTHAIHAHAAHAAGEMDVHRAAYAQASAAVAAIAGAQDRAIVEQTFRQVPLP